MFILKSFEIVHRKEGASNLRKASMNSISRENLITYSLVIHNYKQVHELIYFFEITAIRLIYCTVPN